MEDKSATSDYIVRLLQGDESKAARQHLVTGLRRVDSNSNTA